jgi:hypothetical protein
MVIKVYILLIRLTNVLVLHKAPMDALKYPAHLYNTAHNFFAFLANALVCILNNLAIKIWAGLFYL